MRTKLKLSEILTVASLLFGMFFGAGNLIFPVHMGQMAGANSVAATAGFIITAVTIPILGVAALGISGKSNLPELGEMVGRRYSMFFTCAIYLTIGPFFAIPRCCTTPYTVGIRPILGGDTSVSLLIFSLVFFAIVLFFSLRPGEILKWIGKVINPIFLLSLSVLLIAALINGSGSISSMPVQPPYDSMAFFQGFLDGYNTMDGIASLAFGVIIITTITELGVTDPAAVSANTAKSGLAAGILMAVIYAVIAIVGAQSMGYASLSENGGIALADIATHYFGKSGAVLLSFIIGFATLKTAIGLVTSCSRTFTVIFPNSLSYNMWAIAFTLFSFVVSNVGLSAIISYSVPVLMLLYPLAITIIMLALLGRRFNNAKPVFVWVTALTFVAAFFDFCKALPKWLFDALHLEALTEAAKAVLPFSKLGLGWICPAVLGLVIGLVISHKKGLLRAKAG